MCVEIECKFVQCAKYYWKNGFWSDVKSKLRQILRREGGFVKTWNFVTRGRRHYDLTREKIILGFLQCQIITPFYNLSQKRCSHLECYFRRSVPKHFLSTVFQYTRQKKITQFSNEIPHDIIGTYQNRVGGCCKIESNKWGNSNLMSSFRGGPPDLTLHSALCTLTKQSI